MAEGRLATSKIYGDRCQVIITYRGIAPKIDDSVFVAEGAQIIGDVEIGSDSSVWFNAVVRGDVHHIRIAERTNIQDNAVLHVSHERHPLHIGSDVTIGHGAIVHACTIRNGCLIGMGAKILDDAVVGPYAIVAAGALVLEDFIVPEGMLVAGVPARLRRPLTDLEKDRIIQSARNYVGYAKTYRE
ncbi:MAG TPA: gamma carbonic anhydrase family protein [Bacteroidetes bacterium]|nr:gamma carbonic anhydrase family protein [Bacteroidota bacterium]